MSVNYRHCLCCPRGCGVDRTAGEVGFCRMGDVMRVARAAPHRWEEPCLSGTNGSGAVFFVGCTLRCVYCQNQAISRGQGGREVSGRQLAEIFLRLQRQGCHNINLVTAGHFLPGVTYSLRQAREWGLCIPVVYNCGGYESPQSIAALEGLVDVYLPDFKYYSPYVAQRCGAPADYAETALSALREMLRQQPCWQERDGLLQNGVLVRHLLLPGQGQDTRQVLRLLAREGGESLRVSLMSQYVPPAQLPEGHELARRVTRQEYQMAVDCMRQLGLSGYGQNHDAARDGFVPDFDGTGV